MEYFATLTLGIISSLVAAYFFQKVRLLPKSFTFRKDATLSMIKDMQNCIDIHFVGISHVSLRFYLEELIDDANITNQELKLEKISVYFARNNVGETWEPKQFGKNVIKSVREITNFLSQEGTKRKLPNLKTITFSQDIYMSYFGGCFIQYGKNKPILYIVYYLPGPARNSDTKKSYTSRLTFNKGKEITTYKKYEAAFNYISTNANPLFNYDLKKYDAWNNSAESWDNFEIKHRVYEQIMQDFVNFINVSPNVSVLDLGCGTGRMSLLIAKKITNGKLLLLDRSPKMIEKSMENFAKEKKVGDFIVTDATIKSPLYGEFSEEKFDKIICHFSFHLFLSPDFNIGRFCHSWKQHLKNGSEIAICLHNSIIKNIVVPKGFNNWEDPLKKELEDFAARNKLTYVQHNPEDTIEAITGHFDKAGFKLLNKSCKEYERNMLDRLDMWKVPGIFYSTLKIGVDEYGEYYEFLNALHDKLGHVETKPTTTYFLKFQAKV